MAFWQRVLEGEKYVTGSLVPLAIYTIHQTFLQVIASVGSDPVVKKLTRILLNDFGGRYHPTIEGQLNYTGDVAEGMVIVTLLFILISLRLLSLTHTHTIT